MNNSSIYVVLFKFNFKYLLVPKYLIFCILIKLNYLQRRISFLLVSSLLPCMMWELLSYGICLAVLCFRRRMLAKTEHWLLLVSCRSWTMQWLCKAWLLSWQKSNLLISKYIYFFLLFTHIYVCLWIYSFILEIIILFIHGFWKGNVAAGNVVTSSMLGAIIVL